MPTAVMIVHDTETGTSGGYMAELLECPEETILRAWHEQDEDFDTQPNILSCFEQHGTYVAIVKYLAHYGQHRFDSLASVMLCTQHNRNEPAGTHLKDIG